jgi:DNA topoisomerase-1
LNGRFGPYIKVGKKNVKIPKGKEPKELTLQECLTLAESVPEKFTRGMKKKETAKAAGPATGDTPIKEKATAKKAVKKGPAKKVAAKKTTTKTAAKKAPPKKTAAKKKK